MNTTRMIVVAMLIAGSGLALHVTHAQQPGIKRTDAPTTRSERRRDARSSKCASISNREWRSVNTRIRAPEVAYVLEGMLEYQFGERAAGNAQGRRNLVHPGRNDSRGEEHRHRQRRGTRDLHRRRRSSRSSCWSSEPKSDPQLIFVAAITLRGCRVIRLRRSHAAKRADK